MGIYASIIIEMELSAGVWTDVSADVMQQAGISGHQGIMDNDPLSRVAETGVFSFTLRNDEGCSGGVANYYTPGDTNCRPGFQAGIAVRLRCKYSYFPAQTIIYGKIPADGIQIITNIITGYVKVEVRDFMEQTAQHEIYLPAFTENKRMDEIVPLIIANMPVSPLSTDYNTAEETFATVFDTVKPKTRAMTELNKLAISEIGYVYTRPDSSNTPLVDTLYDEVLVSDGRETRNDTIALAQVISTLDTTESVLLQEDGGAILQENGEEILLDLEATESDAIFNNSMNSLDISHAKNYFNIIKLIIPPRRTDAADTTVLYSNPKPFEIKSGETKVLKVNFRDPNGEATKVTCADFKVPVAGTDYKFTQNEDGTGTDRTANLTAGFSYIDGTEGVEYTMTPTADGWVFILQARGKGVYTYDNVETILADAALTVADGPRTLTIDMKYRDSPLSADDLAALFLDRYSSKDTIVDRVNFVANRSLFLMMAFLTLKISDRIWVINSRANVNTEYFINGKEFTITQGGIIRYSYILSPAAYDTYSFWELEVVGKGELGETTWLGL